MWLTCECGESGSSGMDMPKSMTCAVWGETAGSVDGRRGARSVSHAQRDGHAKVHDPSEGTGGRGTVGKKGDPPHMSVQPADYVCL
eukprot:364036-Chlamydomonas_euryale.AAC.9